MNRQRRRGPLCVAAATALLWAGCGPSESGMPLGTEKTAVRSDLPAPAPPDSGKAAPSPADPGATSR